LIKSYITAKDSDNIQKKLKNQNESELIELKLDINTKFQEIIGFGGAFTEAASYTLDQMSIENRQKVLEAYFDKDNGLNYTIGRVHIHSCDFALENYTYVVENDEELKTFDISRDYKWVIPMIKDAEVILGKQISLLASPWSPPAWMKTNNEMNHGGKLLPRYYQTWANYYVKFIDEYKKAGLNISSITVQNEPAAVQVWDSCVYTAEEERDFVKDYLGPTLRKHHPEVKIIIWDHNRDIIVERANTVLVDKKARDYVWGTGLHWYVSEEFNNLTKLHDLHPDKHILFTEGCIEGGVHLGAWHTGERYARNIIGDLNNYCEGYIDWNLTLNEIGGPNHVGNYCDAPIICDTKNDILHFNSSYYYIGHFSKHILPGAVRIKHELSSNKIQVTTFINPDGEEVAVILNETEDNFTLKVSFSNEEKTIEIPCRSITTIKKRG